MPQSEPRQTRRVGLITPSSNTTIEPDFARCLPPDGGLTLHTARMYLAETTEAAERVMVERYLPQAVTDLASLHPDVVVFACTSAGAVLGAAGEAQLIARIAAETGALVVSTNSAVQRCVGRYAPRRVAVITPYVDELNEKIRAGLEGVGLNVVRISGLGLTENFAIATVSPAEIVAFAERALAGLEFDLLFVSCTNFRGVEARQALAARFGQPVVTSNQATIEATLEALGLPAEPRATVEAR
jgi:maleate isomerase